MVRECKWDVMFTNHHINQQPDWMLVVIFLQIYLFYSVCCICFVCKCFHPLHWLQTLKNRKVFSRTAATDRKWVSSGCTHAVSWLAAGKIWGHYSAGCSVYFPELFLSSVHNFFLGLKIQKKICKKVGLLQISADWEIYISAVFEIKKLKWKFCHKFTQPYIVSLKTTMTFFHTLCHWHEMNIYFFVC